jgi:tetrahydromethanopterin S-methyltransferase subunit H
MGAAEEVTTEGFRAEIRVMRLGAGFGAAAAGSKSYRSSVALPIGSAQSNVLSDCY